MLGSLTRKLRAFGFDTTYYGQGEDEGIIKIARKEARVILTSDKALHNKAVSSGLVSFLLSGRNDRGRISSILSSARAAGVPIVRGDPFCSVCGNILALASRDLAAAFVPAPVARRHRIFLLCKECGKVYWKGGHWKKLRPLERAFGNRRDARR